MIVYIHFDLQNAKNKLLLNYNYYILLVYEALTYTKVIYAYIRAVYR
jgi:hypothetical protein